MNTNHYLSLKSAALALFSFFIFPSMAQQQLRNAQITSYSKLNALPSFITFNDGLPIKAGQFSEWAKTELNLKGAEIKKYQSETDQLGYTHTRYAEYFMDYPVANSMVITHEKEGKLISANGDYFQIDNTINIVLNEQEALKKAMDKVKARQYMWENKAGEEHIKKALNQPDFSYYPKGELVWVHEKGKPYTGADFHLAYKFNIYASEPLYRANVFVDAENGKILDEQNLINTTDVTGTASTKYSGSQAITMDSYSGGYRLKESGRGTGIETYDMKNSTSYGSAVDFSNSSTSWTSTGSSQAGTDAHWGAEKTYDFYKLIFNRNSIDNNGYKLLSYVHYGSNFVNAYWDGQRMTYGDGNSSQNVNVFTALDVCGHEITHGLISNTAQLGGSGSGEPGALNEGFADIFGTSIEFYAKPASANWVMGTDFTSNTQYLRDMTNPKHYNQPDTYKGTNWDQNDEVHTNNGPCIHWYYLLSQGGNGTNDNNDTYTVSGISIDKARQIAYRALTLYFTSNTQYADARTYTIQAALDLFGSCSPEVIATTNAWYAVGVGDAFVAGTVHAGFAAAQTSSCSVPVTINFNNMSVNGSSYVWDFGDGTTGTGANPTHTYTLAGNFTVKMVATGCGNGKDSIVKSTYISVAPTAAPTSTPAARCGPGSLSLTATGAGTLNWYDAQVNGTLVNTGASFNTPVLNTNTTYYITSTTQQAASFGGPADSTFAGGGILNYTHYLIFNVLDACTIKSIKAYAQGAGNRTIELQDSSGTMLQTLTVNLADGKNTIPLNFHVVPGFKYRLAATGSSINLFRNNAGAVYPYTIANLIHITGTDVTATNPSYYYYFYNWQIQKDACTSEATPVTATIHSLPQVDFTLLPNSICNNAAPVQLSASPAGGIFSGNGTNTNQFDPNGLSAGDYILNYVYTDSNGCSGSDTAFIKVENCTLVSGIGSTEYFQVFPNPVNNNLNIQLSAATDEKLIIQIINISGQFVFQQNVQVLAHENKYSLNLTSLAQGLYHIRLTGSGKIYQSNFVKQ